MMSMEKLKAKLKNATQVAKGKLASVLTVTGGVGVVATLQTQTAAAAYNLTGELSDIGFILSDAAALMPDILSLCLAVVPILIAFAIVGFITGLFDGILSQIKFGRH